MHSPRFETWDVSDWEVASEETAGQDEKDWLLEPGGTTRWLFKPATVKGGFRQGEDWSERVSSELAALISVPCAEVQLATRFDEVGSISKYLVPRDWEMQSGALLLAETVPSYQPGSLNIRGRPGHSLPRIRAALLGSAPPPGGQVPDDFSGFDAFAGFLVLDAWIANRDRHDENWSILIPPATHTVQRRLLCGSYDQAGGLGFNVPEHACRSRLDQADGVEKWALKGTAWRFEHDPNQRPITLVEHAINALSLASPSARAFWIEQLSRVSLDTVIGLMDCVPDLSDSCRSFASEVLRINGRRLQDAYQLRFG